MKLLLMKLSSLVLVFVLTYTLATRFGAIPGDTLDTKLTELIAMAPPQVAEKLSVDTILLCVLVFFNVIAFIAFIPAKFRRRPVRHITFEGDHGEVVIQLDPVQQSLTRVMLNMPEIRKVQLKVDPDESGRNAVIHADVILQNQPGINARDTARTVTDYIAESAKSLMGLEDLGKIKLNITGINLNPKKSSRVVRAEHESRVQHRLEYSGPVQSAPEPAPAEPDVSVEPLITPAPEPVDVVAASSVEAEPQAEPVVPPVVEEAAVEEEVRIEPVVAADEPDLAPLKMDDIDDVELPPLSDVEADTEATEEEESSSSFAAIQDDDDEVVLPPLEDEAADDEADAPEETVEAEQEEAPEEAPAKKKKKGWGFFG